MYREISARLVYHLVLDLGKRGCACEKAYEATKACQTQRSDGLRKAEQPHQQITI
jgi:hypothetical protein